MGILVQDLKSCKVWEDGISSTSVMRIQSMFGLMPDWLIKSFIAARVSLSIWNGSSPGWSCLPVELKVQDGLFD